MSVQTPQAIPGRLPASDDKLLATVTEYWMKARIDAPIRASERLDQNAKQMIALAGALQGLIIAVVKLVGDPQRGMVALAATGVGLLLLSIAFSAALLVRHQEYVGASAVMPLLKESDPERKIDMLACQLGEMCEELKTLLPVKRKLMGASFVCFGASVVTSIGCLFLWLDAAS